MTALHNLRSEDTRRIQRLIGSLRTAKSWTELQELFVPEVSKCLGGDFFCWNEMTPDFGEFTEFLIPPAYYSEIFKYTETIVHFCPEHPIVQSVGWGGLDWRAQSISDHVSHQAYREQPLYREAYRYLDTDYQMASYLGRFGDSQLVLTFSRTGKDYDAREKDIMSRIGWELARLSREVLERDLVRARLDTLWTHIGEQTQWSGWKDLAAPEIAALPAILGFHSLAETGLSQRSFRRQCEHIREKLGLDSLNQLRALLLTRDT